MLPSNYVILSYDILSNLQPIQTHMLTTSSWNTLLLGHLPVLNRRLHVYNDPPLCSQVYVNFSDFYLLLIYDGQVKYFPLKYYTICAVTQYASLLLIIYVTANNIHRPVI